MPENWLKEKEAVRKMVGDLAITCLWHPDVVEAHAETEEHDIRAWREDNQVKVVVKHK